MVFLDYLWNQMGGMIPAIMPSTTQKGIAYCTQTGRSHINDSHLFRLWSEMSAPIAPFPAFPRNCYTSLKTSNNILNNTHADIITI